MREIVRIDSDGTEKIYKSVKEAAADNYTTSPNISSVLIGKTVTAAGYRWRKLHTENTVSVTRCVDCKSKRSCSIKDVLGERGFCSLGRA